MSAPIALPWRRSGVPATVRMPAVPRRHYGPVGHLGIDIVEIRNMDLPVLTEYRSRQVAASDTTLFLRHRCGDAFGAGAKPDRKAPFVSVGDPD